MKAFMRLDQQTQFLRAAGNVIGGAAEKILLESRAPRLAIHGAYAASLLDPGDVSAVHWQSPNGPTSFASKRS